MEAAQAIKIMPNPMGEVSTVQFPLGVWTMDVLDIQGRTVISKQVSGRRVNLRRAELGPGSYVLRLVNDRATSVVRFVIR